MNGPAAADDDECHNISQQSEVSDAGDVAGGEVNGDVTGTSGVECDSFCDFVRFEGTVTERSVPLPPGGSPGSRLVGDDAGSGTLLRACIEKYKLLFEALVAARVLQYSQSLTASFMDQFVTASCDKSEPDIRNVSPSQVKCVDRVELDGLTKSVIDTFSLSCQLLVDFSALPIYSESAMSSPAAKFSGKKSWTKCSYLDFSFCQQVSSQQLQILSKLNKPLERM